MTMHPKPNYGPMFDALARNDDPVTSHEAAERVAQSVSRHESIIVDVLRQIGPATSPEIACGCRLTKEQVHKRMAGLTRKGLVEAYTTDNCRTDGVRRTKWRLTD